MTRFTIILLSISLSTLSLTAQSLNTPNYGQTDRLVSDFLRQVKTKDARNATLGSIKGSPYFEEEFSQGSLLYNDQPQDKTVFLRYNAYTDEIEMTPHQYQYKSDQALIQDQKISCYIGTDKYVYLPYVDKTSEIVKMGYLIELYKGSTYSLYLNKTKVFMEATYARTGLERSFPARFTDDQTFYYNVNGGTPKQIKLYKSKLRELFKNKERINAYLRKNRKPKDNIDQWLVDLFEYME